ncbi:MAG: hypothetical protein JSU08_19265 [Acidobacteria bacterium]|nr:hypothetical protein [Acidobacteriota bacterium]
MRRRTAVLCVALAVCLWTAALSPRAASVAHRRATASTARAYAAMRQLVRDAGLEFAGEGLPASTLRAVLIDIDRDGDRDVVANLGAGRLAVWLNDGLGRLRASGTATPSPTITALFVDRIGRRFSGQIASDPDDGPLMVFEPARAGPVTTASVDRTVLPFDPLYDRGMRPSSPRAPPRA